MAPDVRIIVATSTIDLAIYLRAWARRAVFPITIEPTTSLADLDGRRGRLLVVDLTGRLSVEPTLLPVLDEPVVVVLDPVRPLAPGWLAVLQQPNVATTFLGHDVRGRYLAVAASLERHLKLSDTNALVASVVQSEPRVSSLRGYVTTVLERPWEVRRPRDLARFARSKPNTVKRKCALAGFQRVEHFITLTRWLAFQHLTVIEDMPAWRARVVVGIGDPSNFRRQMHRSIRRSSQS